jgi:predicted KAP-like P-loop ATPase
MTQKISSDRPVTKEEEDRFQRFEFSKRIADKIIGTSESDSIVIGIFGAWGEGKTSLINFIESELTKNNKIIPIRFNPWRFTDEATLLVSFFNTLANEIKKSFPIEASKEGLINRKTSWFLNKWNEKKEPLKTNKETIGDIIEKYGKIVSIFGAGEAAESIGKALSNVNIDTLKTRFEKLLIESKKKLVIFIDDIDRLDKQEIHAIFRLVKLTADFSNTFYVLAFDQEMVASAIGDRFGEGDKQAGLSFLEKIIQVPLKIPIAQPDALKQYCFELIDKSISYSEISLSKDEVQRFVSQFVENILNRLKTPRLAVRYGNTLSFSLPLLKGEVNIVDLMLIEALKIFYPKHYNFVKDNSHYFLSSYSSQSFYGGYNDVETKKKEIAEHLEIIGSDLTKKEKESVKSLLSELFPRLDEAFRNTYYHNGHNEWYKSKRIASPEYFKRYFSYTVLKGELSDISFDNFVSQLEVSETGEIINSLKQLIKTSSTDNFLHKLRSLEQDFNWEASKKLAICIALSGDIFPEKFSFFGFGVDSPKSQAAIFIFQLIKKHPINSESFTLAQELMDKAFPFEFAYEINNWLRIGNTEEEKIFNTVQYQQLAMILINRAIKEADNEPLFTKFPNNVGYLFGVWKEKDNDGLNKYISQILESTPQSIMDLMRAFTPVMRSSNYPEPYKSNFTREQYNYFKTLFDKEYIYNLINTQYSDKLDEELVKFPDMENQQTDINILRQFKYWYNKELKEIDKKE